MRIVQVSPYYAPHAGGVESHVRAISGELVRRGHDVTVVTSRYDRSLPEEETLDGVRIVRDRTRAVVLQTPLDTGVGAALRSLDADVIHLHYPPPLTSYFATRALARRSVPRCLTYHCDLYLSGPAGRLLTRMYERILLPQTLDRVSRIIVHTRSYGLTSRPLRGRELAVIPSAVDLDRFRPDVDGSAVRTRLGFDGARVIAFTGRLVPHKGVDVVVRSLPELPKDVRLLVVGRGPRLPELHALARRLGVDERIRFCPDVSDAELPQYLRAADLFVFPSQNRLEGFGLVVAEALAAGLPVVIADMPGVREVIEPGKEGLLVEPMIQHDLVEKLRTLLDDPGLRASMAIAARKRAEERYGLSTVVDELMRVYRDLPAAG
ncbi:MAG TPA: glycosyltransferase family 4 protein [Thermoplasmata archaeon]|nr:glycosyltransferase family 4 protein [Thermoplasmata archaeon]